MINRIRKKLTCLQGRDVIEAKVSDHHPIVHDGVLFWNVMMRANVMRIEEKIVHANNGFGMEEIEKKDSEEKPYLKRLTHIANVIAEMCETDPSIEIISLCEGPIHTADVKHFYEALSTHGCLAKFMNGFGFHTPLETNWGLLMLACKEFTVKKENYFEKYTYEQEVLNKIQNRFQVWKLTAKGVEKYFALLHFPYGRDVYPIGALSKWGSQYCSIVENLLERYQDKLLLVAGDFNFNPLLVGENPLGKVPTDNSLLWPRRTVTVDGILLSKAERQRIVASKMYASDLYAESRLFKKFVARHQVSPRRQLLRNEPF